MTSSAGLRAGAWAAKAAGRNTAIATDRRFGMAGIPGPPRLVSGLSRRCRPQSIAELDGLSSLADARDRQSGVECGYDVGDRQVRQKRLRGAEDVDARRAERHP